MMALHVSLGLGSNTSSLDRFTKPSPGARLNAYASSRLPRLGRLDHDALLAHYTSCHFADADRPVRFLTNL